MQKTVAILILVLLGFHFHGATVLWTTYYGCSEWIAETYCVNPESECCKGKCHITKVEQESDASDSKQLQLDSQVIQLAPLIQNLAELNKTPIITLEHHSLISESELNGYLRRPEHPPRA